MEIEIIGESNSFKVVERTIRDIDYYDIDTGEEKTIKKPHFQARIQIKDDAHNRSYDCDISYYDENGSFVGLDETSFPYQCKTKELPTAFSTALNIPENATKMVVTFTVEKENEFKNFAVGFAIVCGLIIIGAIAIKLVINLYKLL